MAGAGAPYTAKAAGGRKVTHKSASAIGLRNGFAVVVLAAGQSPGRGRPKQLLPYLGRTLVEHAARTALASGACEVVVVVGEYADEIRHELRMLPVRVVHNREWRKGISSSIRTGISRLQSDPSAAVISLCDQPKTTGAHLRALAQRVLAEDGATVAASAYDGVLGAPAAFARSMFSQLLGLSGESGARHLIRNAAARVEVLHFADANVEAGEAPCPQPALGRDTQGAATEPYRNCSDARAPPGLRRCLVAI